jgi:hypothetical protein
MNNNYVEETELKMHRGAVEPVTLPLNNMIQQERIRIIVDELVAGKSKHSIVLEYSQKWGMSAKTVKNIMNEAVVYLHHIHSGNTIEEMRSEQVAKLEELYANASTAEKLKIIDLVSSTLGLYDNNLVVKTEDAIKLDLGL